MIILLLSLERSIDWGVRFYDCYNTCPRYWDTRNKVVRITMKQVATSELTNELVSREGIDSFTVEPYEEIKIITRTAERIIQGPAIILINQD